MDVTFIWKRIGSDIFEATLKNSNGNMLEAIQDWTDCFGISVDECEAFSFYTAKSCCTFEIKHGK